MSPSATQLSPITRRLGRTPRIHALAACVPLGTRVLVDVGVNHGILPITVLRAGRASRCLGIDKSATAIADTRRRLRRCHCSDRVDLLQSDGLAAIAMDQVDVICVAGLGPKPMVEILESGLRGWQGQHVRLVLNPIGSSTAPRAFLETHGFELTADTTVTERGRAYPILVAEMRDDR